jgi:hypothetical protein
VTCFIILDENGIKTILFSYWIIQKISVRLVLAAQSLSVIAFNQNCKGEKAVWKKALKKLVVKEENDFKQFWIKF